jgi:hypothetical protein
VEAGYSVAVAAVWQVIQARDDVLLLNLVGLADAVRVVAVVVVVVVTATAATERGKPMRDDDDDGRVDVGVHVTEMFSQFRIIFSPIVVFDLY